MSSESINEQTIEGQQFGIQRLYVKDLSVECPNSPEIFLEQWEPALNLDLDVNAKKQLAENVHEVVLTISVTVTVKEKMAFLIEVKQAGIFTVEGFPNEQLNHVLGSFCPNILYPYAREVITDAAVKAGFPQLYLAPVNFDALWEQKKAEEQNTTIIQ